MTKAIVSSYELAQSLIAARQWRVDPDLGRVIGKQGQPFRRTNSWGYIQIKFRHPDDWRREVHVLAHRVIWEAAHGLSPEELVINHRNGVKTDNRLVNLELVTQRRNMEHARETGLMQPLRGERQGRSRLTDRDVLSIYCRAHAGEDQLAIGSDYGVGRGIVSNIKRGWAWTHVTGHVAGRRAARGG